MMDHAIENQYAGLNAAQVRKVKWVAEEPASGFYLPLVRTLMEEYGKAEFGASFVFTSTAPREGVSLVVTTLAKELAATSGEKVLIAMTSAIGNFAPVHGVEPAEPVIREGNGVFRLSPPQSANHATRVERFELLRQLTSLFPFVLIDSPALSVSTEALEFGALSHGVVLVSAAGLVRRNRLLQAKRMIDFAGVPLLGCALNRRTYPIPDFLYKRL
jgi:hypothetical protein